MTIETLFQGNNSQSIKITSIEGDEFTELLNPKLLLEQKINVIKALYHYDVSFRIEGFRLLISIQSLPVAPFPDIYPEDSAGARNSKLLETEYQNAHIIFRMFKEQNNNLFELGDIFLQNKGMQYAKSLLRPYLTDGNIPVKLWGYENILKAKLFNDGYGLLAEYDYLQIEIDYSYEITGLLKTGINIIPNNFGLIIDSSAPQRLLPNNLKRVRLSFKNEGDSIVSFAFGNSSDCVIGKCSELKSGESFNDESRYPYQQALWMISHDELTLVSGLEGTLP